jgi:hypothetical protein
MVQSDVSHTTNTRPPTAKSTNAITGAALPPKASGGSGFGSARFRGSANAGMPHDRDQREDAAE